MAIKYTSPHHSREDPGGLIRDALDLGEDFPGPAEDLLLAWTLHLDVATDAQEAARILIARYGLADTPPAGAAAGRLAELLRVTAEQGTAFAAAGRRRGGWRGRRS